MSKLYKKYVLCKIQNSGKIYIFKCGIFYLFIDADAELMSRVLNLKLTNLNSIVKKCGFPVNSSDKYFNILKNTNYEIEIVDTDKCNSTKLSSFIAEKKYESTINEFIKVNIDSLSISQAFDCLHKLQNDFNDIAHKK